MTMTPRVRNVALTAHVTSSVGWLGAVGGFLALAVAGLTSRDAQMVRAAYLAMELTTWFVIVPLSLASLLTGLVQSLGTTWGLFRHYWVVAKLLLNILATILLLLHTRPIARVAAVAAERTLSSADLRQLRIQLVADAGAALLLLLVATTLSVYKPRGLTPYGRRKQDEQAAASIGRDARRTGTPPWVYVSWIIAIAVVLVFVILHLTGRGLGAREGRAWREDVLLLQPGVQSDLRQEPREVRLEIQVADARSKQFNAAPNPEPVNRPASCRVRDRTSASGTAACCG